MKIKKPYFWDLQKPSILSYLLLPLTIPVILNNILLNFRYPKVLKKIKKICIGNIYIGGTAFKKQREVKPEMYNTCVIKKFYSNQNDEQRLIKNKAKNLFVGLDIGTTKVLCLVADYLMMDGRTRIL